MLVSCICFAFHRLKDAREKPIEEQQALAEFTGEEGSGKYLDLHEAYNQYINLKGVDKIEYLAFLVGFDRLFDIPKERKNNEYINYVSNLLDYLYGFIQRAKPILNVDKELEDALKDFESKYDAGTFPGWPKETGSALTHAGLIHIMISCVKNALDIYFVKQTGFSKFVTQLFRVLSVLVI